MKRFFFFFFLFLFSTQSFKPILIRLNFKLNQDYYALFCINKDKPEQNCKGCCQLKKQLKENDEEKSSKDKILNKNTFEFFTLSHFCINNQFVSFYRKQIYIDFKLFFPICEYFDIFRPPRC